MVKPRRSRTGDQLHWGPRFALCAGAELERRRPGNSLIAYPVSADIIDPAMVSKSEPAERESHPKLLEPSAGALLVPTQDSRRALWRAETESSLSLLAEKLPFVLSSCIVASSGSMRTRTLCCPERTGIISDRLPCTESVGIKPNLFLN